MESTYNTESYAYLLKYIDNPQTTIVQHQIEGNTVKMLVIMENGEKRLITFCIPNEECTVNDLLKQAGISFNSTATISLVKESILNINYIVESETDTISVSSERDYVANKLSCDNNVTFDNKYSQNNYEDDEDNNDNLLAIEAVSVDEQPKYIDNRLVICFYCGLTSMDFNRCYHCKKKIENNPTVIPYVCQPKQKENLMFLIEKFYINFRGKLKLHTTLKCHNIKIGSYKFMPNDDVIINTNGLILSVPSIKDKTKIVEIHVKYKDIVKVLIHFSRTMPVLFFYTNETSGLEIRKILSMNNPKGLYYDPTGEEPVNKIITIFPIYYNTNTKIIIEQLFLLNNILVEITLDEANYILKKISPEDIYNTFDITNNYNSQIKVPDSIEKPKYNNEKLAICDNCGYSSIDFNRCYRCKKKIQRNPATKSCKCYSEKKKYTMIFIDNFYKSLPNNNDNNKSINYFKDISMDINSSAEINTKSLSTDNKINFIDNRTNNNINKRKCSQPEGKIEKKKCK